MEGEFKSRPSASIVLVTHCPPINLRLSPPLCQLPHWHQNIFIELYYVFPPLWITALRRWRGLHNSMKLWAMPMQGHPRQTGHIGKFWQNVVQWRREWQATPVFLWWESHEQYEKAKRYETWEDETPRLGVQHGKGKSRGQLLLIAPERMKHLGQSGNDP